MDSVNSFTPLERPERPLTYGYNDVDKWLWTYHDSCERLPALLELAEHGEMDCQAWLRLLGDAWTSFDKVGRHSDWLFATVLDMAPVDTVIPELMSGEERLAFDALQDEIPIYRGCGLMNRYGFSWSLNRRIAATLHPRQALALDRDD